MKIIRSFTNLNEVCGEKTHFGVLEMLYDRVWDGNKFLNENFCPEKPCFHATSHLKIEANLRIIC